MAFVDVKTFKFVDVRIRTSYGYLVAFAES